MRNTILFFLLLIITACSSGIDYISDKNKVNITIDGDYSDWQGVLKPVDKEGLVAGFIKQDEKIFLCFVISDRNKINKLLRFGGTVYLKNDEFESFGIKYPIIDYLRDFKPEREFVKNEQNAEREKNFDNIDDKIIEKFKEFTIVNKDDYPLNTFLIEASTNYKIKMKYKDYKLVYELEINTKGLNLSDDIGKLKELKIGIQLNTFEMPRENRRPPNFDEEEGDDRDFGNRMPKQGGGKMRGERFEDMQKPFEFWFNVKFM